MVSFAFSGAWYGQFYEQAKSCVVRVVGVVNYLCNIYYTCTKVDAFHLAGYTVHTVQTVGAFGETALAYRLGHRVL